MDPQDLLVEPGLTGIVGPNGCGKSNLLEALRWVMGASSARAMRGGEMDDLIFSGAEGRPARESAEVALTLDNTGRTAPAEFNDNDTLEVLRRLKRGAGSTYKLNGRTVRGKDIQLLFADASTGANSPSLVRQGQISELIASKPQNRRRILEEAAGIAGLNSRRHEAELKLRAAETNLERLTEVSVEVERQLESLKRQARKARKYKTLSDEISALEAFAAHLKWEAAKAGVAEATEALNTAKADVERLTREVATAETARIEAGDGIGALREAEALAGAKLGQARIALARLEAEHKAAADAKARLEAEAGRLIEDMEREQAAIAEAQQALETTQAEISALPVMDAGENAQKEAAAREAVEAARTRLREAEGAADGVQQKLSEARARQHAARNARQAAEKRVSGLEAQERQITADLAALPDISALEQAAAEAERRENEAELALQDAERAQEAAEAALADAREAETGAEPAHSEAKTALGALEAEISGLKRLLQPSQGPSAPPVIQSIRTEDGYEKAVAAALGDDLQAPTDSAAALYWAGGGAPGQPLPQGARPLAEFVEAPGELSARLAQCGVVGASEGAGLAAQLRPGQRLVSTEGHLWRWDGFVRTPKAPVSAAERLAQQARLEAAEAELPALQDALNDASALREELKQLRLEAEEALRKERATVAPAGQALNSARRAAADARQALERASVKHESVREAAGRIRGDLALARDTLSATDPVGAEGGFDQLEAELSSARASVQAAREAETEARGRLTDLTHGREQAEKRRAGLERDLQTWAGRKSSAEQRLEKLVARRREAADQANAMVIDPDAVAAEVASLTTRVEGHETERKSAADKLAERETSLREAESALRQAETAAGRAREQVAGSKVKLENYESRLADVIEHARETFQRQPEGLLTLAKAGLEEETLLELDQREAENRAMVLKRDRDA
ncbi:MAG: AAA family ATPase, partial [Pseudomonadota bacterium]